MLQGEHSVHHIFFRDGVAREAVVDGGEGEEQVMLLHARSERTFPSVWKEREYSKFAILGQEGGMGDVRTQLGIHGLRTRLIMAFLVFAVFPMVMIPALLYQNLSLSVASIEMTELNGGVQQLENAIHTHQRSVLQNVQDYAHWDDAVRAFREGDKEWFQNQVFDYVTKHYGYEYIIVADLNGRVVWEYGAPEEWKVDVSKLALFQDARNGTEQASFMRNSRGFAIAAAANIIPLAREGHMNAYEDAVGVIIYGDDADTAYADTLANTIGRHIDLLDRNTLFARDSGNIMNAVGSRFLDVSSEGYFAVMKGDRYVEEMSDILMAYYPVETPNGQVVGAIRIGQSRLATNFVRRELVRAVLILFCVAILLLILLAIVIGSWLVNPVGRLAEAIRQYGKRRKLLARDLALRKDELGEVYRAFEELVRELDLSEHENISRERELRHTNKELARNAAALGRAKQALETKLDEISKLNRFMIGREVRMADIKRELKQLKEKGE